MSPRPAHRIFDASEFAQFASNLSPKGFVSQEPNVLAGLAAARIGQIVSLADAPAWPALPHGKVTQTDTPTPYQLRQWSESGETWTAVNDRLEIDIHGAAAMTHLDAPSHFSWEHGTYRSERDDITGLATRGIVGRGVLIDVENTIGEPLEGRLVTLDDVQATLAATGITPVQGDILHFRFGRTERARSDVALGSVATPGLSIDCAEWLFSVGPSAIVTDEGLDSTPGEVDGLIVPWHVLVLTILGIPLIDRAMLTPLGEACAEAERWEFLSILAPLPIPGASGSPLNPLAIL